MRHSLIITLPIFLLLSALGGQTATTATADSSVGVDMSALIGEPTGAPISGSELDRQTEEVTSIMRCPVCQGLSIADSDTLSALAIKNQVQGFLAAGYSQTQVLTYFEQAYGEFIRLEPKAEGFNLVVWIAPIVAFLIGVVLLARWVRVSAKPASTTAKTSDAKLEEYLEKVREETA
jgi:cytochrome c-type biogenesis protein CcmH